MDAVERGDMETAQRMVNERAEALRAEVFAQTVCHIKKQGTIKTVSCPILNENLSP